MKKQCLLYAGMLCIGTACGQVASPPLTSDILCWQEGIKLKWLDFQAVTRPDVRSTSLEFLGATTYSEAIVYDYTDEKGTKRIKVRAEFSKSKSWVEPKLNFDKPHFLEHEQIHFDISELTARKLRRLINLYIAQEKDPFCQEITDEIGCLQDDAVDLQNLFDQETDSGKLSIKQVYWKYLIEEELAQLARYKSTAADCQD